MLIPERSLMHLEVRHLKLVNAIAEEGSVTSAGKRLHLTQSALSHQLRDIEDRLGTPLYHRVSKKMLLTQAGELLLRSARSVLAELERAEEEIQRLATRSEGLLRIATQCYTGYHWLPSVLERFHQKFPRVEVRIVAEATGRPIEALLEGKLDLALVSSEVASPKLSVRPLFRDELVVVMKPGHRLSSRPHLRAEDFAEENFIVYRDDPAENLTFRQVLIPAGVRPRRVSQVQLTEAMIEMVKAGLGIAVMASWVVAPQLDSGALRALPLTERGLFRQWSAAHLKSKSTPAFLLDFVERLAQDPRPARPGTRSSKRKTA